MTIPVRYPVGPLRGFPVRGNMADVARGVVLGVLSLPPIVIFRRLFMSASSRPHARLPPRRTGLNPRSGHQNYHKWESCRTILLVDGSFRGSPASSAPSFRCRSIFSPITLISSQDLAVKSHPNLFTHSPLGWGNPGDPRENPPTSGIAQQDSHGSDPAGNRTRFSPRRNATSLTTRPPLSLDRRIDKVTRPKAMLTLHQAEECTTFVQVDLKQGFQKCSFYHDQPIPYVTTATTYPGDRSRNITDCIGKGLSCLSMCGNNCWVAPPRASMTAATRRGIVRKRFWMSAWGICLCCFVASRKFTKCGRGCPAACQSLSVHGPHFFRWARDPVKAKAKKAV
ncbi:hypothetical protein PR048_004362 [Dryococelus australis]|uniref:Uncharacterized protein n=1 Tax=Dryococelus australis TaxID=614101 RepID=A0ABQ9I586_9NEOP|nr:hypothetical protein PR048_004362 [Dryococelus australis]